MKHIYAERFPSSAYYHDGLMPGIPLAPELWSGPYRGLSHRGPEHDPVVEPHCAGQLPLWFPVACCTLGTLLVVCFV